jgi:hypothetical protein
LYSGSFPTIFVIAHFNFPIDSQTELSRENAILTSVFVNSPLGKTGAAFLANV